MLGTSESLILTERHLGTEKKIGKRALVENPVDDYQAFFHLKIEPVFLRAKTIEHMPVTLDLTEIITTQTIEVVFRHPEFFKQLQLLKGSQS